MRLLRWIGFAVLLCACDGTASFTMHTGWQEVELSTNALALPTQLRDDTVQPARIATLPCPTGLCPTSDALQIVCEAGVCDPGPKTFALPVGDVIDIDAVAPELSTVVRHIDAFEVQEVAYDIRLNTLSVDVPPIELHWGPEAAATVDPAVGVHLFGTVPSIAAGQTGTGQVAIDPAGAQELSDYLVHTSHRVRFFARTVVDLEPGTPFPDGSVRFDVNGTIRVVGSILR